MSEPSSIKKFFSVLGRIFSTARSFTANLIFLLLLILVVSLVFSGSEKAKIPEKGALVLSLSGVVVEQRKQSEPFAELLGGSDEPGETTFRDIMDTLKYAREDSRIPVLLLDLEKLQYISAAHMEAVGRALQDFRASGKEIIASGDYYSQQQYYLASFADAVYMHPLGQILLTGYENFQPYFKDLLEKLKVKIHVFRVGTYKAAVEPFIRSDMSPAAKEANRSLLQVLWHHYLQTVADNRQLDQQQLQDYADHFHELLKAAGGDMGRVALEKGLVDELVSRDEIISRLIAKVGEKDNTFVQVSYADYLSNMRKPQLPSRHPSQIAVIEAKGNILMGDQPRGSIGADTLVALIRQVRQDDNVKALVMRVDSPGGSAFASELIREELELTQMAGKPVITSMAGVAASGGYWISATSDEIWAQPTTITGSIGIFGLIPTFEESLAAVGIGRDGVGTTQLAGALSPLGDIAPGVADIVQSNIENGYQRFLNLVARGRDMTPDAVDKIAQGRVWSGETAKELGLVDQLGGLQDAIASAAEKAGLEDYQVQYVEKPLTPREQFIQQLSDNISLEVSSGIPLKHLFSRFSDLLRMNDPLHSYVLCEACAI